MLEILYGYARCSTDEEKQDITRQKRDLKNMGVDEKNIYFEYESGSKVNRIELKRMMDKIESDRRLFEMNKQDVKISIVATELSRITRSTRQLYDIIEFTKKNKIRLVLGSFVVDCSLEKLDPMTEGMLKMMGIFAELELNMTRYRVKSGMENARANGKQIGRPQTELKDIPASVIQAYELLNDGKINKSQCARMCKISRPTLNKYLKILDNEK